MLGLRKFTLTLEALRELNPGGVKRGQDLITAYTGERQIAREKGGSRIQLWRRDVAAPSYESVVQRAGRASHSSEDHNSFLIRVLKPLE